MEQVIKTEWTFQKWFEMFSLMGRTSSTFQKDEDDRVFLVENPILVNVDVDADVDVDVDADPSVLVTKKQKSDCWSDCQRFTFCLFGVLLLLASIGLVSYYIMKAEVDKACTTLVCHQVGHEIKSFMDQGVAPCDDFYRYACGNWNKLHPGDNETSALTELTKENTIIIRNILESSEILKGAGDKARNFYMSCLNKKDSDKPTTTTWSWDYVPVEDDYETETDNWWSELTRLEKTFTNLRNELEPFLNIQDKKESLSLTCVALAQKFFPDVTARLFAEKVFPLDKLEKISFMLHEISVQYQITVAHLSWMDDPTKTYLIAKLSNTSYQLGYPPSLMDTVAEVTLYSDATISNKGSSYYTNLDVMERHVNSARIWSFFGDEQSKLMVPEANAFYQYWNDQIFITAGIAREPFFSADVGYPDIVNYAKFAITLGHEYTHAFEEYILSTWGTKGAKPDNISTSSYNNFLDMKKCLVDEYDSFKLANSSVILNATLNWDENLADVLGLQLAFAVFEKKYIKSYMALPGLETFTPEQVFFIAAAQTECRSFASEEIRQRILQDYAEIDSHSPNSIRVLGEMANNDDFSQAFNCPIGSPYNSLQKCRVFY